ncbi:MAG: glycosyltransferase family 4 protein [Minisyncoccia bacterium]
MDKKTKLFIATLDPAKQGGVPTMAKFVYTEAIRDGLEPWPIYNIVRSFRQEKEPGTFSGVLNGFKAEAHQEVLYGLNGIGIDRVLPELEFFNYLLNLRVWKRITNEDGIFFGACGANLCMLPFALLNKDFSLWVATTLYEDKIDRVRRSSLSWKIRDILSLPILLWMEGFVFRKAKRILALSTYTKDCIMKKYGVDISKIDVAFYPIDSKSFYPIPYGKRKNDYILFTGRITDLRKNAAMLISAFAKIHEEFPWVKLKFAGEIPGEKLFRLVRELGVSDHVEFIDFVRERELLSLYQNALLFVIPSLQEGLCISGLEALACGIPVISTKCGGPEDFVVDGVTGYLVNNDDEGDMVEKMRAFLNMKEEGRKSLSMGAVEHIKENNSIEKIWPKFRDCFIL